MTTKKRATTPTYLVRQPHSYCFRMVVPPRHRLKLGRAELRYPFHTGSLSQAKARARTIAAYVLDLFSKLGASQTHYTPTQLQLFIRDFVADQHVAWTDHSTEESASGDAFRHYCSPPLVPPQVQNSSLVKNSLTKVISEYATEKKSVRKWRTKTEQENLACYRVKPPVIGPAISRNSGLAVLG